SEAGGVPPPPRIHALATDSAGRLRRRCQMHGEARPDGASHRRVVGRDRTAKPPVGPEVARLAAHAGPPDSQRTLGLGVGRICWSLIDVSPNGSRFAIAFTRRP